MSELTEDTVRWISELSRIHVSDEDVAKLFKDLSQILEYVNLLDELDTEGVPACNQVLGDISMPMRDDEVEKRIPRERFLSNAPDQIGGMVRVPQVIQKGENS